MNPDVEATIPQGSRIITPEVEEQIKSGAKLIEAGANPETILRSLYLFGWMDGGMEMVK